MHKQTFKPRVCRICKRTFTPTSTRAKTCSPRCSAEYHRRFCLDKAREIAFLTPYDIDAFIAKNKESKQKPTQNHISNEHAAKTEQRLDANKNPEPKNKTEREEQRASVIATMNLPPSQRFQFARLWSNFQRNAAIAIEKRRIAEHFDFCDPDSDESKDPADSNDAND